MTELSIDIDPEWLSLSEASDLLGAAPSTVRRWGDAGLVPTKRTLGGHRRFQRAAVERMVNQQQPDHPPVPELGQTRHWHLDTRELMGQGWHARFDTNPTTERMRGLGQRLFGMLMQYVNSNDLDERILAEAKAVGATYGREAREMGVSMHDTVEAFLFFRRAFAQLAKPQSVRPIDVATVVELRTRLDLFMDATLLGTIEGFEQAGS
jgi:excisionase family DNA binding protein